MGSQLFTDTIPTSNDRRRRGICSKHKFVSQILLSAHDDGNLRAKEKNPKSHPKVVDTKTLKTSFLDVSNRPISSVADERISAETDFSVVSVVFGRNPETAKSNDDDALK